MYCKNYIFADVCVSVSTNYLYVHDTCSKYYSTKDSTFSISISKENILNEYSFFNIIENENEEMKPPYLEFLAVQRKLSEALIDYNTILFHASALEMDGKAYLFTALSGTGKSTHARLWREQYGDRVTMINDDKPFIHIDENEVRVYGSPWDGKHHLSTNTSAPVKAIILLERDTTNHIERINAEDAFHILYQQTYRSKDPEKLAKTLDLLSLMTKQVEFYRLHCNMEPEAALVSYEGMNQ